jgi:hypothetical protein
VVQVGFVLKRPVSQPKPGCAISRDVDVDMLRLRLRLWVVSGC